MTEQELAELESYRGDCFCESQCQECNWSLSKIPALTAEVRRLQAIIAAANKGLYFISVCISSAREALK